MACSWLRASRRTLLTWPLYITKRRYTGRTWCSRQHRQHSTASTAGSSFSTATLLSCSQLLATMHLHRSVSVVAARSFGRFCPRSGTSISTSGATPTMAPFRRVFSSAAAEPANSTNTEGVDALAATASAPSPISDYSPYFSTRSLARKPSAIRELQPLLALDGMISLGGGMPNPETFPFTKITVEVSRVSRASPPCCAVTPASLHVHSTSPLTSPSFARSWLQHFSTHTTLPTQSSTSVPRPCS